MAKRPVTIRIDGTIEEDIQFWAKLFRKGVEHRGDSVGLMSGTLNKYCEFTIHPKANND